MNRPYIPLLSLCTLVLWVASACNLPEDPSRIARPAWQPEIAVPLVNSNIQLASFLPEIDTSSFLQIDSEGLLSLAYEADLFEIPSVEVIQLPDVTFPMIAPDMAAVFPIAALQRIGLKQGQLAYEFSGNHVGETRVRFRILNAVDSAGQFFERTISFNSPGSVMGNFNLADYTFELTDGTVDLQYQATTPLDGQTHTLGNAIISLNQMRYHYLEGYIGQYDFNLGQDSVLVELSDALQNVQFQLTDPKLTFVVENAYGVPVEVRAEKLSVVQADGNQVEISSEELREGLVLNYPALNEVGERKTTAIELNKDNSGLPDALNPFPTGIVYRFGGTAHPTEDSTEVGFVTDTSTFSVGIGIEVPLEGTLAPFTLEDTLDLEVEIADVLESAGIILITENGFPIDLSLQAYFLDDNGVVLDSLLSNSTSLLTGARVDTQGKVNETVSALLEIDLTNERIQALLNSSAIAFRATVSTTDQGTVPVRIYEDYELGLKMGLRAKVSPL